MTAEVRRFVHAALRDPADDPPPETGLLRRRVVCALTLLLGSGVLAWSLRIKPGDVLFYPATLTLAAVWVVGAIASGPLPLGHARRRGEATIARSVGESLLLGTCLLVIFLMGAVLVAQVPALSGPVQGLLDHARHGSLLVVALITALNGFSEELFFRGALFAALPHRGQVLGTTVLYTTVTALAGVPLLALAAALLGVLLALQRRATGGCLAPTLTHLTWSLGMLLLLGPTLSLAAGVPG